MAAVKQRKQRISRAFHPTDIAVGARIRVRRTLLGLSQERLANALNLTFQQVQKYERGANRVSASMLQAIARVLDVPISYFFEEEQPPEAADPDALAPEDVGRSRGMLELVRAYNAAPELVRQRVTALLRAVAESHAEAVRGGSGGGAKVEKLPRGRGRPRKVSAA